MRALCWFSCGAASAIAAKLTIEKYKEKAEILYCDTFAYEHPDNRRFFDDVQNWLGQEIKILRSEKYSDIYDVFKKTRYLVGNNGARCTTELKKNCRRDYQQVDDIHIFGFTVDEQKRIKLFYKTNPELQVDFILNGLNITKHECYSRLKEANIEIPMMYKLGYKNNNCIGCVKGNMGYWNKIRKDFPDIFNKMAAMERELGRNICHTFRGPNRERLDYFLDELPPTAGNYKNELEIECGVLCNVS